MILHKNKSYSRLTYIGLNWATNVSLAKIRWFPVKKIVSLTVEIDLK